MNMNQELSPQAIKARREYHRQWRQANKDKVKEYARRHFEKLGQEFTESKKIEAEKDNA